MPVIGELRARLKLRKLSPFFFLIGTLCYAFACAWCAAGAWDSPYRIEAVVLSACAWICSAVTLFIERLPRFLVFHCSRLAFTLIVVNLLLGRHALPESMLAVPFILETMICLRYRHAIALASAFGAAVMLIDLRNLLQQGGAEPLFHCAWILLFCAVLIVMGALLMFFREAAVGMKKREKELELSAVSLESAIKSYQDYAEKVELVSEEHERNRITREIHDTIGYALTNIGMLLQAAKTISRSDPPKLNELLEEARKQAKSALMESRRILHDLRATERKRPQGLQALWHLTVSLRDATGIQITLSYGNAPPTFGDKVDKAVFRLVQEGITNAIKHGKARKIRVLLWVTDAELQVRIWDSGRGSPDVKDGIGITGMRERFAQLGGRVEAHNVVDGFLLAAYVPVGELSIEAE